MDPSITAAWITRPAHDTEPTPPATVEPLDALRKIKTAAIAVSLLVIVLGSAADLIADTVLTGLALVLVPVCVRILATASLPRWVGGLGLAVTASVLTYALDTWSP